MAENLVIVESPAKAKTIKKYLGKDFEVLASYGHVRDLVPKEGAVDPEHGFRMQYRVIERNEKHVVRTLEKDFTLVYVIHQAPTDEDAASVEIVGIEFCDLNGHGCRIVSRITGQAAKVTDVLTPREIQYWTDEINVSFVVVAVIAIAIDEMGGPDDTDWVAERKRMNSRAARKLSGEFKVNRE